MTSHFSDQLTTKSALRSAWVGLSCFLVLLLSSCATLQKTEQPAEPLHVVVEDTSRELLNVFAPVFVLPEWQQHYNQIGMVVAKTINGREKISINPDQPILYVDQSSFSTPSGTYINLIYRVHFQKTPFSLIPFHFGAGGNVGLLVIITLNNDHIPVLVTVANTCGCYAVVIPTVALPVDAYPENWTHNKQHVYGEIVPASLPLYGEDDALLITVRPEVHRFMNANIIGRKTLKGKEVQSAKLMPLQSLKTLPLEDGNFTSFYYDAWPLQGHVKGSIKPWESLLLGLFSLDFYVGMDKEYGDTAISRNPFYTSLLIWNRHASDMNNFAQFLNFLGWKL